MLNLLLLTAAISLLFVWRLAATIPLDSDPASDSYSAREQQSAGGAGTISSWISWH